MMGLLIISTKLIQRFDSDLNGSAEAATEEAADGADEDAAAPIDAAEGGAARNAPDEAEAGGLDEAGEADGQPEVVEVVEVEDEVEDEA